jgi:hypothetical protein
MNSETPSGSFSPYWKGISLFLGSANTEKVEDDLKRRNDSSQQKKRDPVLHSPPSSFRRKHDIIDEIEESAKTLFLSRSDTSLVFHRSDVDEQVVVTKKALTCGDTHHHDLRVHAERHQSHRQSCAGVFG